eukprot:TRINITY_DN5721_c0_g1_i5.p1 TRINITY_DN5721_c0_g1~~TRINITY_DN5721_c0_g1_i5.p1  ORF type:complete len:179 (-),score=42.11 TRINITY_DN5721_c0_g1_i5:118-654(-)
MPGFAYTIALLGLNDSGKTTLAKRIANNNDLPKDLVIMPTAGISLETLKFPKIKDEILIYDLSGEGRHRQMWPIVYEEIDAIIFVIDINDTQRISSLEESIKSVVQNQTISSKKIPILFTLNKTDVEDCPEPEDFLSWLEFDRFKKIIKGKWTVKEISSLNGSGVEGLLDWIDLALKK